jgi:hypothetical protein
MQPDATTGRAILSTTTIVATIALTAYPAEWDTLFIADLRTIGLCHTGPFTISLVSMSNSYKIRLYTPSIILATTDTYDDFASTVRTKKRTTTYPADPKSETTT